MVQRRKQLPVRIDGLSRKTVNTREHFWNVYCFATNQMRHETATDNRQTAGWSSHDLTRNNELAVSPSTNLHVYRYQMLNVIFFHSVTTPCCGLEVIFRGFISHLIGREAINIPEIFSGVHGFTGKTVS